MKKSDDPNRESPGLHHTPKPANKVLYNKHKNRKNHEIVAAMYAMYRSVDPDTGEQRSLEHVGKVYKKSRQAIYDLFKSRGYVLRSKPMRGLQVYDGIKFTLHKGGYLRGTVRGTRVLMHHYIWEKYKGELPADHCIYHKDRNKENNDISNLALVHKSQMSAVFNPNNHNQYTKKPLK
jgi:hypothetical protein